MKLVPLGDRVVLKQLEAEVIIAGGCKLKIRYTYWQRFIFREMIHVYGFVRD